MDNRDLPGLPSRSQAPPDLGDVFEIAGRLMRLRTGKGDLGEALRTAAADLQGIADTLTPHETRWPFLEGID